MEINPQTWIFNYQILGKDISFGGVLLKLATVIFLVPFSQYWRQSAGLDEQRQFICQSSHAPVRSSYLEMTLKFLSKLFEQQKGNAVAKQLQTPFNPERQNKQTQIFLIKSWAIQCDHPSVMKATGVGRVRNRTLEGSLPPQQWLCLWHNGIAQAAVRTSLGVCHFISSQGAWGTNCIALGT